MKSIELKRAEFSQMLTSLFDVKNLKQSTVRGNDYVSFSVYINGIKVCAYDGVYDLEIKPNFIDSKCKDIFNNIVATNNLLEMKKVLPDSEHVEYSILFCILDNVLELITLNKKIKAKQVNSIVFGYPNCFEFKVVSYKMPLTKIKEIGKIDVVQKRINEIREKLMVGECILNTNLDECGLV